jgi:hypothetical protein
MNIIWFYNSQLAAEFLASFADVSVLATSLPLTSAYSSVTFLSIVSLTNHNLPVIADC